MDYYPSTNKTEKEKAAARTRIWASYMSFSLLGDNQPAVLGEVLRYSDLEKHNVNNTRVPKIVEVMSECLYRIASISIRFTQTTVLRSKLVGLHGL